MKLECHAYHPDAPPIVPGKQPRQWMDDFKDRHPYRCLPLNIVNCYGWDILMVFDCEIEWNGGPGLHDIRIRADHPAPEHWVLSNFTRGVVTFHTGYEIHTDPGWSTYVTGPVNDPKPGMVPLSAIVETFWLPYPFGMNWRVLVPGGSPRVGRSA
jgi:hypothetical protein